MVDKPQWGKKQQRVPLVYGSKLEGSEIIEGK